MKVGILGGGIMGITTGYFLAKKGVLVEIFEASPSIGGLASSLTLEDGTKVDRFYHTILSSDSHLRKLSLELEIADQFRFNETKMGFFYKGEIYSMNNVIEFLRFPPLGWIDRFRLGLTILYAQFVRDWHTLESISVEKWLTRLSGKHTYENIWLPMLKAKFDGSFDDVPATYIWSRLVRMKSTRSGANQKEEAGHLVGGYISLIKAMAAEIKALGGKIHLKKPVSKIEVIDDTAIGVHTEDGLREFDKIIATVQPPIFQKLIPDADADYIDHIAQTEYLGVICPLLALDRPLTGYWTLNLTDNSTPFTGVIETTSYINPKYVGGHHLVYLPKYVASSSPLNDKTDEEIKELWLGHLLKMFPDFDKNRIRYFVVQRAPYVEPLHPLNGTHIIPEIKTPFANLYLATNAQIYPALTNGESITRMAKDIAKMVAEEIKEQDVL